MVSERGTADARGPRSRAEEDERCPGGRLAGSAARRSQLPARHSRGASAGAMSLVPPKPNVFFGVSDRGTTDGVQRIRRPDRQAPGAAADLPPLGQQPQRGLRTLARNGDAADPPHLHRRRPDPGGVDHARADRARLRRQLPAAAQLLLRQTADFRAYIRPLGEPNRCLNPWSAVNCYGTPAWRRTHDRLVQAGLPPDLARSSAAAARWKEINATLAEIGLPPAQPDQGRPDRDRLAAGAGVHHLEPAARRLAAGQGQLPGQLLARQPLGRLGRHRLLLGLSRLAGPQPLLLQPLATTASPSR